jgi:hypothetical protein
MEGRLGATRDPNLHHSGRDVTLAPHPRPIDGSGFTAPIGEMN